MIARVFPSSTIATPRDDYSFIGEPPMFRPDDIDKVHVSCTFTWDRPRAEYLAKQWGAYYADVKVGGPAYDDKGGDFVAGMYLGDGYTITSRGCPNNCSFCFVPKREGKLRTLKIVDGYNILDNNLLACPRDHIEAVMGMLSRQKNRAEFTGGIDARLVEAWWCKLAREIRPSVLYLAYDHPSQANAVQRAVDLLYDAGFKVSDHSIACYMLVGYKGDTLQEAKDRSEWLLGLGVRPYAMYYRDNNAKHINMTIDWRRFIRECNNKYIVYSNLKGQP